MQWFRAEICKLTLEAFHIPQGLPTPFSLHRYLLLYLLLILWAISASQSVNDQILLLRIFPQHILLSLVEAWLPPWHRFSSALLLQPSAIWTSRPDLHVSVTPVYATLFSSSLDISQAAQRWTFHIWIPRSSPTLQLHFNCQTSSSSTPFHFRKWPHHSPSISYQN